MKRGDLFVLSAPSGAGKTTLIGKLMSGSLADVGRIAFSVSHTTREPRRGEVDGVDYHFVDSQVFGEMIAQGQFLEWAEVHDNYYGTSYQAVMPLLEEGVDVIVDIDVQGGEQVLERLPEAHGIFIMPPSFEDLERRLRRRGLDDADEISRRLAVSLLEIRRYKHYDYVIINDDLKRASEVLAAIILDKHQKLERQQGRIDQVLTEFEDPDSGD